MTESRDRILERVSEALATRKEAAHPGPFEGARPSPSVDDPVEGFVTLFTRSGGAVVRVPSAGAAHSWLEAFAADHSGTAVGATVPPEVTPSGPTVEPRRAALGVSAARAAVAETGSLILDARDGRLTQLLPPTHVVLLRTADVHGTLREALEDLTDDLPSAVGLHSGPSKSADIGQILVKGVHGPGRVVALLIEDADSVPEPDR